MPTDTFEHPTTSSSRLRWLKVTIALLPVFLFLLALNQRYVLVADVAATWRPGASPSLMSVTANGIVQTGSPPPFRWTLNRPTTSFQVLVPRRVETVRAELSLVTTDAEIIRLKVTGHPRFGDLESLIWSKSLNQLAWPHLRSAGLTLWQRPVSNQARKVFSSVEEMAAANLDPKLVAAIGVDPYILSRPNTYQPSTQVKTFPVTIRGRQSIYVYAASEDLKLAFEKQDLNFAAGRDPLTIRIRRLDAATDETGQWLYTNSINDDGDQGQSGPNRPARTINISLPQVLPGMYRIDLVTSDDVLIRNLRTPLQYLGIQGRLYVAAGPVYRLGEGLNQISLQSDTSELHFTTFHNEGKQRITVGSQRQSLSTRLEPIHFSQLPWLNQFIVDRPDVVIEGNGLFTAGPFRLPPRRAIPVDVYPTSKLDSFSYVISTYQPTTGSAIEFTRTWKLSELKVNTRQAIGFSLQRSESTAIGEPVGVKKIRIIFDRGPFPWTEIRHKIGL